MCGKCTPFSKGYDLRCNDEDITILERGDIFEYEIYDILSFEKYTSFYRGDDHFLEKSERIK